MTTFRDALAAHIAKVDRGNEMTASWLADEVVGFTRTNSYEMTGYRMGPAVEEELFEFVHHRVATSSIGGGELADAVVERFNLRAAR